LFKRRQWANAPINERMKINVWLPFLVGNETYLCYSLGGDVLRLLDKALSELKKCQRY
jgi:hypothetical protein